MPQHKQVCRLPRAVRAVQAKQPPGEQKGTAVQRNTASRTRSCSHTCHSHRLPSTLMSSPLVHSQQPASPRRAGTGGGAGLAFPLSVGTVGSAIIEQRAAGQQVFKEDPKRNSQVLWSVFERSSDISINKTILTLQCTFPIIILPQNG